MKLPRKLLSKKYYTFITKIIYIIIYKENNYIYI